MLNDIILKKILLKFNFLVLIILILGLFFSGCLKDSSYSPRKTNLEEDEILPYEKILLQKETSKSLGKSVEETVQELKKDKKLIKKLEEYELDFKVENLTGKTIYVTCFSYINKEFTKRWRMDKSDIYQIENGQTCLVDIDTIPDRKNREHVYGVLAVFDNKEQAEQATYELLPDANKIELDLLFELKDKKVAIMVEKYGYKGDLFAYDFRSVGNQEKKTEELDFWVENNTGKPVYVTCFVYNMKKDMPAWAYDKTDIIKILPGKMGVIDVDTTYDNPYDRVYMRGYLAVFDEFEKIKAEEMTYELLESKNKIYIGRLIDLLGKKIVLDIEKYGATGTFVDYSVRPAQRIDFTKLKVK